MCVKDVKIDPLEAKDVKIDPLEEKLVEIDPYGGLWEIEIEREPTEGKCDKNRQKVTKIGK